MAKLTYIDAHDRLKAVIDEARWVLTDSDLEQLKPVNTPIDMEKAIRQIQYGMMNEDALRKHPFANLSNYELENADYTLLKVLRDPEFFPFACYHLFEYPMKGRPLRIMPFQHIILMELWWRRFPLLCASRGTGKTILLSLFILLKLTFHQGIQIAVVSRTLRQSKLLYEYIERLWNNSAMFRDLVGDSKHTKNGPRAAMGEGRYEFRIGDSIALFLPLGATGENVRGIRAQVVVVDEAGCLDPSTIIETDKGLMRIGDCESSLGDFKLVSPDSEPLAPSKYFKTPPIKAYKITTTCGYSFICSDIHKTLTNNGWQLAKDLTKKDYILQENNYKFPEKSIVSEDLAWLMGSLTAEGSVADDHAIHFTNTDYGFITRVADSLGRHIGNDRVSIDTRKMTQDPRGWKTKQSYTTRCCHTAFRNELERLGMARVTCHHKVIPWSILQSARPVVIAYLAGLFEGDGSAFLWKDKSIQKKRLVVTFYSVSEQLASEVQVLLLKLGYSSDKFSRKSKLSNLPQWAVRLHGESVHKLVEELKIEKWKNIPDTAQPPRIWDNKGVHYLKDVNKWRATYNRGDKWVHVGKFKSKEEASSALLPYRGKKYLRVKSVEELPGTRHLYDFTVPPTNAFYGNGFVQHNSMPEDIYNVIVQGFGAVAGDPVEKAGERARQRILGKLGLWNKAMEDEASLNDEGNQSIMAGTGTYHFNHFYKQFKLYNDILKTNGDEARLREILRGPIPRGFNWKHYSVMRIPWEIIPHGYMDEAIIGRAKQVSSSSEFDREYRASFIADSDGFFKRSLIEKCTIGGLELPLPSFPSCENVDFQPALAGDKNRHYVYGIDPALINDNFAVVIEEVWPDHRRVVFCWTTRKSDHRKRQKAGKAGADFYAFAARKLRDLFKVFPPAEVVLDAQGGGGALEEKLRDPEGLEEGELPIYRIPDEDDPLDTDFAVGSHVLRVFQFANAVNVSEANWGLHKDLETRSILFPRCDAISIGIAYEKDIEEGKAIESGNEVLFTEDGLEDVYQEIEELKNELTTIEKLPSANGQRERWDTIGNTQSGSRKGYLRKDRYSALVMANWRARALLQVPVTPQSTRPNALGGRPGQIHLEDDADRRQLYICTNPRLAAKLPPAGIYARRCKPR